MIIKPTDRYLARVLEIADKPAEVGYVRRLRLQRATLKLHRAIAASTGSGALPTTLRSRLEDDGGVRSASNDTAAIVANICQPSEAIGRQWIAEWRTLRISLSRLAIFFDAAE